MVSQNRNVQFFKKPTYLLPVIHGQAATWLKDLGYDIYWDDGNSQLKNFGQWYGDLLEENPDVVVNVEGHQYWFEFEYPDLDVVTANELHIPVGKTILINLDSLVMVL